MKYNSKGFTLVELIVVITILAILGTIAFISLGSYTTLARNAVRLDGISKVATVVENKTLGGIGILAFVNNGQEVPNAQIGGEDAVAGINYGAGEINTSALELKSEDFSDPSNSQLFRMGATTKKGGQYEIIATLEEGGTDRSQISGTYEARQSEILSGSGVLGEKKFVLADPNDLNKLYRGDIVSGTGVSSDTEIQSISSDGLTLTLSNEFTANSNAIQLASSEVDGMVVGVDGSTPVTNGSTNIAYRVTTSPGPSFVGNTPESFVTLWKTDNPGTTSGNQIQIPVGSFQANNFTIDWGDGTTSEITSGTDPDLTHTYASPGEYVVSIDDIVSSAFSLAESPNDASKLLEIQQWGDIQLGSNGSQFRGANNMTFTATDEIDISNVTSLALAFDGATNFNGDVSYWDTSNVNNMGFTFRDASNFNSDISDWDTSSVGTMNGMFVRASLFNQDINTNGVMWDVSNVGDMAAMFAEATAFDGDISNWNPLSTDSTSYMFYEATAFNQDISGWNTPLVENMSWMFFSAESFNQNISGWSTPLAEDMAYMFRNTVVFDQDLSGWDVSSVTTSIGFDQNSNINWTAGEKPSF